MRLNKKMTVYYIDPSITDATLVGDGSTAAKANNCFPSTLTDNTIYLIRRTAFGVNEDNSVISVCVELPRGTFSVEKIAIVGMPKSTDELYQDMPADAKTAWGADDYEYANIMNSELSREHNCCFSGTYNFWLHRIQLMDDNTNSKNSYSALINLNDNCRAEVLIENCKFRNKNGTLADLDTDYRPGRYRGNYYLNIDNDSASSIVKFKNNIIEHCGDRWAICIHKTHDIILENNTVYSMPMQETWEATFRVKDDEMKHNLTIKTMTCHYVYGNTGDSLRWFRCAVYDRFVDKLEVDTVTSDVQMRTGCSYGSCTQQSILDVRVFGVQGYIKNVNITNTYVDGLRSRFLNCGLEVSSYPNDVNGQYFTIDNVTLTASSTRQCKEYYADNGYSSPWTNNSEGGLLNCWTSRNYQDKGHNSPSNIFLIKDCHLSAYAGQALRATCALLDFNDIDIVGACAFTDCIGKIKSISSWFPGNCVSDGGWNLLYINTITCNRNNGVYEYNGNEACDKSWRSKILCTTCNIKFTDLSYTTNDDYYRQNMDCLYVCTNSVTTGNYIIQSINSYAQTWSIYREGGTSCSLKLVNTCCDNADHPLILGGEPFKGFKFNLTKQEATLNIYLTMFGYNSPAYIKKHLKAKITLPDGTIVWSTLDGTWYDDETSTWNNVDNNTSFKLSVPVKSASTGEGYICYYFDYYCNDASSYLDPYPEIV